jgi:hypothetical protein
VILLACRRVGVSDVAAGKLFQIANLCAQVAWPSRGKAVCGAGVGARAGGAIRPLYGATLRYIQCKSIAFQGLRRSGVPKIAHKLFKNPGRRRFWRLNASGLAGRYAFQLVNGGGQLFRRHFMWFFGPGLRLGW